MRNNDTFARSLHDVGLAGWFGSIVMGAAAVNRAAGDVESPTMTGRVTNGVWRRWWPVNALFVVLHLVGATRLAASNSGRLAGQRGVGSSSAAKTVVTVAAVGAAAYSGYLGKKISDAGDVPLRDGTTPAENTPRDVRTAVERQGVLQWVIPALTGVMIVLSALQGEQQRPSNVAAGTLDRIIPGR